MSRLGENNGKRKFLCFKKSYNIWDVNFDDIVISKLVKAKTNSKYFIGMKFNKATRPLVMIIPKMSEYVKVFIVKKGDKDKNNKWIYFRVEDEKSKAIRKVKAIWTKIEDLKNIKRNALSVYDDRYLKTRIRTSGV